MATRKFDQKLIDKHIQLGKDWVYSFMEDYRFAATPPELMTALISGALAGIIEENVKLIGKEGVATSLYFLADILATSAEVQAKLKLPKVKGLGPAFKPVKDNRP